jgi:hypothetical protein
MKTLRTLFLCLMLASPVTLCLTVAPPLLLTGCKQPASRATYTTIASVAQSVDIAEREYLDGVLAQKYSTNNFTQIEASYDAFQSSLRLAIATARNDTNALAPLNLSAEAAKLISAIQQAKGAK